MEIKGYKVFIGNQSDFKNNVGLQCKVGQILETTKPIAPKQNGYHFAKRLEDTLRFGNALHEDVIICEVTSLGDVVEYEDEYYGYFELYVTSKLRIDKILNRKEIIEYADSLNEFRLRRFVQTMRLTDSEAEYFKGRSFTLDNFIDYYHYEDTSAFKRPYPPSYKSKNSKK